MPQATKRRPGNKPRKPYPDFPLFPHATHRWAKKIRGKLHYFGAWHEGPETWEFDWQAALARYQEQRDDLHAGRAPRMKRDGLTVRDLANHYLTSKRHRVDTGELSTRSFADYYSTCERIIKEFGVGRLVDDLAPTDFDSLRASIAKTWGPVALGNEINRVRMLFKYATDVGLLAKPTLFGPSFQRPSKKTLRKARHARGSRMLEAGQIKTLLAKASPGLAAMIHLGINCGFGNSDVAALPIKAVDLKSAWVEFPRPKTQIPRRCRLWPETVKAIKAWLDKRPDARRASDADLLFVTRCGDRWVRFRKADKQPVGDVDGDATEARTEPAKGSWIDSIALEFGKLLVESKLHRPGLGFYALRHTFETIGGESRDQVAVDAIMGHAPSSNDMAAVYRERITDERLQAVSDYVRRWLFARKSTPKR